MIYRPKFKPHLHVEIVEGQGVFVLSELNQEVLKGQLYELVAPLINGNRSLEEIASCLKGRTSPAKVYYTVTKLEERGFLCASDDSLPLGEAALWPIQNINPQEAVKRLTESSVSITGILQSQDNP